MKHIPNFLTSLNLACGFASIILISQGNITGASWMILAAMAFDFLDGFAARILKAYSDMGKELDSLADVVSFGVAPAFMLYIQISTNLINSDFPEYAKFLFAVIPFVMPVCAALRLAKFNTDISQATFFRGLPTPANALAVVTLFIGGLSSDNELITWILNNIPALTIFTLVLSLLMVSRLPLFSLKANKLSIKGNEERYVMIIASATLLIAFGLAGSALIVPLYLLISVAGSFARR
jgi:CDP-diacylglycerol--serine O-phosphatidyltransferase